MHAIFWLLLTTALLKLRELWRDKFRKGLLVLCNMKSQAAITHKRVWLKEKTNEWTTWAFRWLETKYKNRRRPNICLFLLCYVHNSYLFYCTILISITDSLRHNSYGIRIREHKCVPFKRSRTSIVCSKHGWPYYSRMVCWRISIAMR